MAPFSGSSKREFAAFRDPFLLTLLREFVQGQILQHTLGSGVIVILPPRFDLAPCVIDEDELSVAAVRVAWSGCVPNFKAPVLLTDLNAYIWTNPA